MNELHCDTLWPTIGRLAKQAVVRRAAVAYVTSDEIVRFGNGDILVTDASDQAIAAGLTNARVLQSAFKRKARLYSMAGLHAKVMVFGNTAVIGSANLSNSSIRDLVEAAWVTNESVAVGMAIAFINQLIEYAKPIDTDFIRAILAIDVKRSPLQAKRPIPPEEIALPRHRTWIVSVRELTREPAQESKEIESGTVKARQMMTDGASEPSWMRWTNNSLFRREASVGDIVIRIWTDAGCTRPRVYRHAPIVRRQEEITCTRFFVEDFSDCEATCISLTEFTKLLKNAGFTGRLGRRPTREISQDLAVALERLWS